MQEVPSVKFASITSFPPIVLQVDPNDKSVVPKVTQHRVDWIGYRSTIVGKVSKKHVHISLNVKILRVLKRTPKKKKNHR